MNAQQRYVLRVDGTREAVHERLTIHQIEGYIGAHCLDFVPLRHMGNPLYVMAVDDVGHVKGLPMNVEATKLYHANCIPGTKHVIVGDVVVCPDEDFAP